MHFSLFFIQSKILFLLQVFLFFNGSNSINVRTLVVPIQGYQISIQSLQIKCLSLEFLNFVLSLFNSCDLVIGQIEFFNFIFDDSGKLWLTIKPKFQKLLTRVSFNRRVLTLDTKTSLKYPPTEFSKDISDL